MSDYGFSAFFPILFMGLFVFFIAVFVVAVAKGLSQWGKNNRAPRLTVNATVVSRRTSVQHTHHNHGDNMAMSHSSTSTSYYVTFQVESGDRMEFHVSGREYGLLAEGDRGGLTFQGTRYLGFSRTLIQSEGLP